MDFYLPPVFFVRLHLEEELCRQSKGNRVLPRFSGCQLVGIIQFSWRTKYFRVVTMGSKHSSLVLDGEDVKVINHDGGRIKQKDLVDVAEWDNYILAFKNWTSPLR